MTLRTRIMERFQMLESGNRLLVGGGIALCLILALLLGAVNSRIALLEKRRSVREADLREMLVLKQRFLEANALSQRLTNRLAATRADDSPAKLIEEIGIKGKGSQIRPVKGDERPGFVEDAAEVKVEGLTANEAVNLLFRLEKGARPVLLKKADLKTRFDDPARLDLALTVALLKPAAVEPR